MIMRTGKGTRRLADTAWHGWAGRYVRRKREGDGTGNWKWELEREGWLFRHRPQELPPPPLPSAPPPSPAPAPRVWGGRRGCVLFRGAVCPACFRHGAGSCLGGVTMKSGGEGGRRGVRGRYRRPFVGLAPFPRGFWEIKCVVLFHFIARDVTAPQGMHGGQG